MIKELRITTGREADGYDRKRARETEPYLSPFVFTGGGFQVPALDTAEARAQFHYDEADNAEQYLRMAFANGRPDAGDEFMKRAKEHRARAAWWRDLKGLPAADAELLFDGFKQGAEEGIDALLAFAENFICAEKI